MQTVNTNDIPKDTRRLISSLLFAAATTASRESGILLLNAAEKIAKLSSVPGPETAAQPKGVSKQLTDRQNRLLQHCLGMYDPDDVQQDCEHFAGEEAPGYEEAVLLLTLLETGDVTLSLNQEKYDDFVQREVRDVQNSLEDAGVEHEEPSAPVFFGTINGGRFGVPKGGIPTENGGTTDRVKTTVYPTQAEVIQTLRNTSEEAGPLPSDAAGRLEKGKQVARVFLDRITQNLPQDERERLFTRLQADNDHLGGHIKNGDVPEEHVERVAGFHRFMNDVLSPDRSERYGTAS